jgi:iron(III) transport system permease protein
MTCGATTMETVRHITLRLATPALLALAMVVFIRGIEAFEVPALVGLSKKINVLTTEIYLSLRLETRPDLGRASAFAVVLLLVVSALLYLYSRIARSAAKYQTVTGKGYRPRLMKLGRARWLAAAAIVVNFLVIVALPILGLLWISLMPYNQGVSWRGMQLATLANYALVLDSAGMIEAASNTLILSLSTATTITGLAALTGWLVARRRRGAWILDQLATIPLIFPGIVLAVAMMQIFLAVPLPIYGTLWILLIAFTIRYLPYGLRYSFTGVLQIHRELEEVAGASGASPLKQFRVVVLPLIAPAMAAGWLFIFLMTSRDLSMPVLLSGPNSHVVAVELFDLWTNGQATELAAFGLVWTGLMTVLAIAAYLLAERTGVSIQGS